MPTPSRLSAAAAVAAVLAVAAGAGAGPSGAAPKVPKIPKIKTRIAKLTVDVAGYMEIRRLHDTATDCFPGQRYIQTNTWDFETGRPVNVTVTNVSGPGLPGGSVATSNLSKAAGSASVEGELSQVKETNYCKSAPVKLPDLPKCSKTKGKTQVSLVPGEIPASIPGKAGDDDLATLQGRPLNIAVWRAGGTADRDCAGGAADSLTGPGVTDTALATTSIAPNVPALTLPANLDAVKVFAMRKNQSYKRTVTVSGPCTKAAVRISNTFGPSPASGGLNADGDCWFRGKLVLTVRPRTK